MENNLINFILELGVEELPARLLQPISNHIKSELEKTLQDAELGFKSIEVDYTPRRLFFEAKELVSKTNEKTEEIKGPPAKIAFDANQKLTQAGLGFAKKNNLDPKEIYEKDSYLYGKVHIKGIETKELLESKLPEIIMNVPGERFMRTQTGDMKFSRPLQWIAAVIEAGSKNETLSFSIEHLNSSNLSYGHRFLGPDSFEIKNSKQYIEQLRKQGVYLKAEERKEIIASKAKELAKSIKGVACIHEELLDEVTGLIENPTPILCDFDKKFLELPSCVAITVMESHQKYFPILKTEGSDELLPYFITVSNNPLKEAHKNIKEGNEKVIVPRLKDAEFFCVEDNKIKLEERFDKLAKVNFQSGNMLQKSERIQEISKYLAYELSTTYDKNPAKLEGEVLDKETRDQIAKAAHLCKTDLSTQMVFEFTELQGEIGAIYASKQGYSNVAAKAIGEHYKPRFADDETPSSIGGKIISIADKIDNLAILFGLGKIPKGSADPFALRRQANGLLEIVIHCHLITNLEKLVDFAIDTAKEQLGEGRMIKKRGKEVREFDWDKAKGSIKEFLEQRLSFVFEELHQGKEINEAVLATGKPLQDLNKKHMMIHYMYELKEKSDFPQFAEAANRLMRIGDKSIGNNVDPKKFTQEEEKSLYENFKFLESLKLEQIINEVPVDPKQLLSTTKPINNFFDKVMVNDEDKQIKNNRHALVNYASSLLEEFADFTML